MKIGYPCINLKINCKGNRTFRLKSYSEQRFRETVENNLKCLAKILRFNVQHNILFFRITSDLIPFASHPICSVQWQDEFYSIFRKIGSFIKKNNIRISMHPDQFVIINAKNKDIVNRSIQELIYHTDVLDSLNLDASAKIQLHIGGVYGDKKKSITRFINNYKKLPEKIMKRLVIENDHQRYNLADSLYISKRCSIPILFDYFHHKIYHEKNNLDSIFYNYIQTWSSKDGKPMCDYSSQRPNHNPGSHAYSIDLQDFSNFIEYTKPYDIDIMLEIKEKEQSALKAIDLLKNDERFIKVK